MLSGAKRSRSIPAFGKRPFTALRVTEELHDAAVMFRAAAEQRFPYQLANASIPLVPSQQVEEFRTVVPVKVAEPTVVVAVVRNGELRHGLHRLSAFFGQRGQQHLFKEQVVVHARIGAAGFVQPVVADKAESRVAILTDEVSVGTAKESGVVRGHGVSKQLGISPMDIGDGKGIVCRHHFGVRQLQQLGKHPAALRIGV